MPVIQIDPSFHIAGSFSTNVLDSYCHTIKLPVISIRYGGAGHLYVIAAEEEQQRVAREADRVGYEHELNSSFWPKLQPLQQAATHEDTDASARDCD